MQEKGKTTGKTGCENCKEKDLRKEEEENREKRSEREKGGRD